VLDSFNAPPKPAAKAGAPVAAAPAPPAAGPSAGAGGDEFEADLIEGMESLLRSLAAENPPGPMADAGPAGKAREATPGLSSEEDEKAFQRALEMMMSGEGLEAMGLDKGGAAAGPSAPRGAPKESLNFEETIKRAMESVNTGGAGAAGGRDELPGDLAALLKQLGEDPSALDGFGDDDDELGGLLDGMMAQLMSKEVLEEPMTELAAKVRC
jgi:peroxin-19